MATLHVMIHAHAAPGRTDELRRLLVALVPLTRAESGCLRYELLANETDPDDLGFVEEWTGTAALEAHLRTPHVQAALAAIGPLISRPLDIRRYRALA